MLPLPCFFPISSMLLSDFIDTAYSYICQSFSDFLKIYSPSKGSIELLKLHTCREVPAGSNLISVNVGVSVPVSLGSNTDSLFPNFLNSTFPSSMVLKLMIFMGTSEGDN